LDNSPAPAKPAARRSRKRGGATSRRKKTAARTELAPSAQGEAAAALTTEPTPPAEEPENARAAGARPSIRPTSPAATVEERGDAIIIRLPPAAPHPFGPSRFAREEPPLAETVPPRSSPPPPPASEDDGPVPAVDFDDRLIDGPHDAEDDPNGDIESPTAVLPTPSSVDDDFEPELPERFDEAPESSPPAGGRPQAPARTDGRPLSASQKRRLRRKRRAELMRPAGVPGPQPPAARPTPPRPAGAQPVRGQPRREERPPGRRDERRDDRRGDRRPGQRDDRRDGRGDRRRDSHRDRRAPAPPPAAAPVPPPPPPPAAPPAAPEPVAKPVRPTQKLPPVDKEMVINFAPHEECRIAILSKGKLEEIYIERASAENYVGNIYKGIITNVEPSIQAAFVDFGMNKNGFLHITDLHPKYFPNGSEVENVGRKMPRRSRPPIQRCLRRGQELIVQIQKEGIGTKGPTLSTYLAIPGRYLVMMPGMGRLGVSRKVEDDEQRQKLRSQLQELELPEGMGFIARTAAVERTKRELQSDLNYLVRLWRAVESRMRSERPPAELYRESDLVIRTIRDVFTSDIQRIVVDHPEVIERAREFLSVFSPRSRDAIVRFESPEPIFHHYGIEQELERLHSRHVPLRSGGSLVIDQTEALVAIDVNSGKFRAEDDAEATAFKINVEAADEISRQLRLRDLGGVIVCDFIDMRTEAHRREIERRLNRNLKEHKERAKVLHMSAFGIIELTRQRQRASLTRNVYQDCAHCRGTGLVKTLESMTFDVMRQIQLAATRADVVAIEVAVAPVVADIVLNQKRAALHRLETEYNTKITIRPMPTFRADQSELQCADQRGRPAFHP